MQEEKSSQRARLVTEQSGAAGSAAHSRHVSSVVIGFSEITQALDAEEFLHAADGWEVTRGEGVVVARKDNVLRVITAHIFDPMEEIRSDEQA